MFGALVTVLLVLETTEARTLKKETSRESSQWIDHAQCSWATTTEIPDYQLFDEKLYNVVNESLALEEAKERCALGCEARYDCMSAELYWTVDWASKGASICYLKGVFNTRMCEEFGGPSPKEQTYMSNQHWAYNYYFYQRGSESFEAANVCFNVKIVTKTFELFGFAPIEWSIGTEEGKAGQLGDIGDGSRWTGFDGCINKGAYRNWMSGYDENEEYNQECCLPKDVNEFTITCLVEDTCPGCWGDEFAGGWNGGYLEINGGKYCDDFSAGYSATVALSSDALGSGSVPCDEVCCETLDTFNRAFCDIFCNMGAAYWNSYTQKYDVGCPPNENTCEDTGPWCAFLEQFCEHNDVQGQCPKTCHKCNETPASKSWTQGHKCPRGTISDGTLFSRQTGLTLEEAKTQCALGCDSRDDCMFADLYYTSSSSTCYLRGSECGDWETNTHPSYHLYRKE